MTTIFNDMEACVRAGAAQDEASFQDLCASLRAADWRVQYAAVIALGDRPDARAIEPLLAVLRQEDAAPIFSQPGEIIGTPAGANFIGAPQFPDGTTPDTIEAWRRRGRIKQAACLTLGAIGSAEAGVLDVLHRYAIDQQQDYAVRAAACKALGLIASPQSKATLEQAATDGETCTRMEAVRALKAVLANAG